MPGRPTRELIAFSKLFIPIALVVAGLTAGAIIPQQRAHLSNLKDTEQRVISQERQILETAIAAYVSDVEFLAASTARHLEARLFAPAFAANLEYQFVNFARGRTVYDQVRFLDATGQERIRVNMSARGPALVPVAMLQNKNKRPYFSRAMQENGGVIISQLDLNIEHGEVEHPFRPVLRFSKAVLDDEGNILGVVVLNFRGQLLLDSLRNMSVTSQGRLYLLNPAGYWLIGPSTDAEWGFMFEPKKAAGFFLSFPREWQTISSKRSGQFTTDKGLFTFDTVSPLPKASRMGTRVMHGFAKEEWTIVSYAPTRLLVPQWHEEAVWLALITLIVLGAVSRLWAVSHVRRQEAEQQLRDKEELLSSISESAQDGIVMTDSKGRTLFANPAALGIFGYDRDEFLGKNIHALLGADEQYPDIKKGYETFSKTGEGPVVGSLREMTGRAKDGTMIPVELSISAFQMRGQWYAVGTIRDTTQRKEAERKLREMATIDGLTSIANRRHFLEQAEKELQRARRYGRSTSMIMFDADHFKNVNDTYGHDVGDDVLRMIARVGRQSLRDVDIFGRIGGEEFAVLLPETSLQDAGDVAERIRRNIEAARTKTQATEITITISLGLAMLDAQTPDVKTLLKHADKALYEAKNTGRNRLCIYTPEGPCEDPL